MFRREDKQPSEEDLSVAERYRREEEEGDGKGREDEEMTVCFSTVLSHAAPDTREDLETC